jgi:hypothetical protein
MRTLALTLISVSLLAACATETGEDGDPVLGPSGKADSARTEPLTFELAQAGAFSKYREVEPLFLHYGFTNEKIPGWDAAGSLEIKYDEEGDSLPLSVTVSEEVTSTYLAFVLESADHYYRHWGVDQFVVLDDPAGQMVELPFYNSAPYPFSPECYHISVYDPNALGDWSRYDGRVIQIYYGFTNSTFAEYKADNNVAWYNVEGHASAEGIVYPSLQHDGGYKGTYRMLNEWIRVPEGMNLVFKPEISKYDGVCGIDGDTHQREITKTKTYFAHGRT